MSWLGGGLSKRQKTAAADPAKPIDHNAFNPDSFLPEDALDANRCRTREISRKSIPGKSFWLQAARISQTGGWILTRVDKSLNNGRDENKALGEPIYTTHTHDRMLTFREVLKKMGELEHVLSEDEEFTGPSEKDLGGDYYKTVARKEGVIFDEVGTPRPASHGYVIGNGSFTEEQWLALVATGSPTPRTKMPREVSLLTIAASLGTDDLVKALENRTYLGAFLRDLNGVHVTLTEFMKKASSRRFRDMDIFFEPESAKNRNKRRDDYYYREDTYPHAVGGPLAKIRTKLDELKPGLGLYKALSAFLYEYQIFALLLILKDAYTRLETLSDDDKPAHEEMIETCLKYYIDESCKLLEKEGADPRLVKNYRNLILIKDTAQTLEEVSATIIRMHKETSSLDQMSKQQFEKLIGGDYFGVLEHLGAPTQQKEPPKGKAGAKPAP